jgi:hypothetical protein
MSWFPLFLDIAVTRQSQRKYLQRVLAFVRPDSSNALIAAREEFDTFGKALLVDVRNLVYSDLSIIDNKTNSLMQLNAILVAVYSIAYGNIIEGKFRAAPFEIGLLVASIFLCLASILLLMTCVYIRWETYEAEATTIEEDLLWWINLRNSRTWRYRLAWCANVASIFLFMALLIRNYDAIVSVGTRL